MFKLNVKIGLDTIVVLCVVALTPQHGWQERQASDLSGAASSKSELLSLKDDIPACK